MAVLHPGSGKKVSFLPKKVRESQGVSFLTTRMNPDDVGTSDFLLVLGILHMCRHVHM